MKHPSSIKLTPQIYLIFRLKLLFRFNLPLQNMSSASDNASDNDPHSIYQFSAKTAEGNEVSFDKYKWVIHYFVYLLNYYRKEEKCFSSLMLLHNAAIPNQTTLSWMNFLGHITIEVKVFAKMHEHWIKSRILNRTGDCRISLQSISAPRAWMRYWYCKL